MKTLISGLLMLISAISLLLMPVTASAETSSEKKCYSFVQGNITWDKKGEQMNWNPQNVKKLCKGVTSNQHMQPGLCYSMVQGNVPWNKQGNKNWNWTNIVKLCKGTNNAQSRVSCFKGYMVRYGWSKAINRCIGQVPPPSSNNAKVEKKCYNFVQNNITWDTQNKQMRWNPKNVRNLCKGAKAGKHAEPGLCYAKVQGKVAWSKGGNKKWNWKNVVKLCKGSRDSDATISCFKNKMPSKGWSRAIRQCHS